MNEQEISLVHSSRKGDVEAWRDLMAIHAPRLAAYIGARLRRPEIVDKLVADTIFVAWKHVNDFDDVKDFPSWFRKMGGSVTMSWYKRNHGEGLSGEFPVQRVSESAQAKDIAAVDKALGTLPEKERMALEQRFRAGLEGEDLAEVLHKSESDADALLEKALAHLNDAYNQA